MLETSSEDGYRSRCKKFVFRLLASLHAAGNLSYRTEETIEKVAGTYNMNATCTVFPLSAMVSFNPRTQLNASSSESYSFRTSTGFDCSKLSKLNQLSFDIIRGNLDLTSADARLQAIEDATPLYPWYLACVAAGLLSLSTTILFLRGSWFDGLWSFSFGVTVYLLHILCLNFHGLSEIQCFLTAFVVTVLACCVDKYVHRGGLCLYSVIFGGVAWLLPGITITVAVLELYSKMIMYGSSRLIYGVSLASQLGFGVTMGCKLIFPTMATVSSFRDGCSSRVSGHFEFFFLLVSCLSSAILNNTSREHMPGMLLVAGSGYFASFLLEVYHTSSSAGESSVPLVAAIVVTTVARLYCYYSPGNQRPLIFIISGLLVLVPGGISLRGMSSMWAGEVHSGFVLTLNMLMIGVSLAIGIFLATLPGKQWLSVVQESNWLRLPLWPQTTHEKRQAELDEESQSLTAPTVAMTRKANH